MPLTLELLTINGKSVAKKKLEHIQGKQNYQFGKSNLVNGIYMLKIKFGSQIISRKLIINK